MDVTGAPLRPGWLTQLERSRREGTAGAILTFVTTDRVICPELGDPLGLKYFLARHFGRQGFAVASYSLAHGLEQLADPQTPGAPAFPLGDAPGPQRPEETLPALTPVLRDRERRCVLIVDYADHLVPASPGSSAFLNPWQATALETLHAWGTDDQIRASGNLVILISHENQIAEVIRRGGSGYRLLQVNLPDLAEREYFISLMLRLHDDGLADRFAGIDDGFDVASLAKLTRGLRCTDIEGMFRLAAAEGIPVSERLVAEAKARSIREIGHGLLEVIETPYGFESVAGTRHALDYLVACERAKRLPRGILLAGVPGTGKSYLVRAVAKEFGFPGVAMRTVREQWVGATERNFEQFLWIAETLSPCIVWIDEIDQFLGQRSTSGSADAGTNERVLARLWEFMGETSSNRQIIWIGTTNRPDLLDAATIDRFGTVIPFIHPAPTDIEAMLPLLARQADIQLAPGVSAVPLLSLPNLRLITIRNLHEILATAAVWAKADGGPDTPVAQEHLLSAAADLKPNFNPVMHEFLALKALEMTTFQSLLPWRTRNGARTGAQLPPYLEGLVADNGTLLADRLEQRLHELQADLFGQQIRRQI